MKRPAQVSGKIFGLKKPMLNKKRVGAEKGDRSQIATVPLWKQRTTKKIPGSNFSGASGKRGDTVVEQEVWRGQQALCIRPN